MRTPPLLDDFIHTRGCKPICEKLLTLPLVVLFFLGVDTWKKTQAYRGDKND